METVAEGPYDSIAQMETQRGEYWVQNDIQGHDLAVVYVVADLPAEAAFIVQHPCAFGDHPFLETHVMIKRRFLLVLLAKVVRRGRYRKPDESAGKPTEHIESVALVENGIRCGIKLFS